MGEVRRVMAVVLVSATAAVLAVALVFAALNHDLPHAALGISTLLFAVTGALVALRRPGNRIGWLLCGIGLVAALNGAAQEYAAHAYLVAPGPWPGRVVAASLLSWTPIPLIGAAGALLPLLFPDGQPVSPRWRIAVWAAYGYIVLGTIGNGIDPGSLEGLGPVRNPAGVPALVPLSQVLILAAAPCLLVAVIGGLASLVVRWRRARGDERQQVKWFVAGFVPLLVPIALHEQAQRFSELAFPVALALIPVAIGIAVLRYRLYELDVLINRALVYTILSALVAGGYVGLVALIETVLGAGHGRWVQALAAVAAALALAPLRSRVQWLVDRLLYGDRSTPYDALTRLGRLLERAPVPETVLPGVVTTIAEALRVPYVAIELREGDGWQRTAGYGTAGGEPEVFPMVYQDETVGRLLVGHRAGDDEFTGADRRLLRDLARQAGVAAHAVQLTLALQRSRAGLVTAREEERRRLRRDLHDGLGPALAGVTLGLHAARANLVRDTARTDELLRALAGQVDDAVADIRRLVYGLRPPALDELGLTGALSLYASRLDTGADGPSVAFDLPPDGLGELPAAVEAAAYRIVTEALTNVSRHADARTCRVRLARTADLLDIEVLDDGTGVDGRPAGVGVTAMRERAAELGGVLSIESPGTGTRVHVQLPVVNP